MRQPVAVNAILDELKSRCPLFSNYFGQLNNIEESLLILADNREMHLHSLVQPGEKLVLARGLADLPRRSVARVKLNR